LAGGSGTASEGVGGTSAGTSDWSAVGVAASPTPNPADTHDPTVKLLSKTEAFIGVFGRVLVLNAQAPSDFVGRLRLMLSSS
jgi:hypothetical protein